MSVRWLMGVGVARGKFGRDWFGFELVPVPAGGPARGVGALRVEMLRWEGSSRP